MQLLVGGEDGWAVFHLLCWDNVCSPIEYGVQGFDELPPLIKSCWVSGYRDMELRATLAWCQ